MLVEHAVETSSRGCPTMARAIIRRQAWRDERGRPLGWSCVDRPSGSGQQFVLQADAAQGVVDVGRG